MAHTNRNTKSRKPTKSSTKSKPRKKQTATVEKNPQLELLQNEIKKIETKGKPRSSRKMSFLKDDTRKFPVRRNKNYVHPNYNPEIGNIDDTRNLVPTSIEFLTEENYNPFPDYFRAQFFNGQVIQRKDIEFERDNFHRSGRYSQAQAEEF